MLRNARIGALAGMGLVGCMLALIACTARTRVGSDCITDRICEEETDPEAMQEQPSDRVQLIPNPPPPTGAIQRLDLLLIIDGAQAMATQRGAFAEMLASLLTAIRTGNSDGAGTREFYPIADMHLGIVASDLATSAGVESCTSEDGALRSLQACGGDSDQPFLVVDAEDDIAVQAERMGCAIEQATGACPYSEPLEAGIKALWNPQVDQSLDVGGARGALDNAGFLRDDALLVVIVLTDRDDCSIADDTLVGDPLAGSSAALRCVGGESRLQPIARYVQAYEGLRTGVQARAVLAVIAGVPPQAVSLDAIRTVDFEDEVALGNWYAAIEQLPPMTVAVDSGQPDSPGDNTVRPACTGERGSATPARRLLQAVREFGPNGLLQSICEDDMTQVKDALLRTIGWRLGPAPI